jgi:phosphoglycerate dehydrogenase-like enzyme
VWFERAPATDLLDLVGDDVVALGPGTQSDVFAGVETAAGVVAAAAAYRAEMMDRALGLKVIARTGIGYDNVDVAAATARGIAVCNTPDGPTVSTAEHAVALILAASKGITRSANALRTGQPDLYSRHRAIELEGKTLGLVGFGRIARRVARGGEAMGMHVLAYDPHLTDDEFFVEQAETLDRLLAHADVVSVHVPLVESTRRMFDRSAFAKMRTGSVFVNTARGGLVDQEALLDALDSGRLMAAGLDVTSPEPLPSDHPLLKREDVIVTPHVASATKEGRRRIFGVAMEQLRAVLEGRRPLHLINPEVWERHEENLRR